MKISDDMKIFFDTEFYEDGKTIDLMSIGMVREDGQELYLINRDCNWDRPLKDFWHRKNTLPSIMPEVLSRGSKILVDRKNLVELICTFVGTHAFYNGVFRPKENPTKPEFWAYYADYDWVTLCQLFGRMIDLPDSWPMYCRDFKQLCDEHGHKPRKQEEGEHNALSDALWLKKEYDYFHKFHKL